MIQLNTTYNMDCMMGMKSIPDGFVDCCVTSPPYWGLRDYGIPSTLWPEVTFRLNEFTPPITIPAMQCCLGLEKSPVEFIGHAILIFRQVLRVLKPSGTLWLNMGDSYVTGGRHRTEEQSVAKSTLRGGKTTQKQSLKQISKISEGIKPKDLVGIPWMLAFALRADGWYLRQDEIWSKPNPMPESVTDRCSKAHEYIFLLSKSPRYYFDQDAIRVPIKDESIRRLAQDIESQNGSARVPGKTNGNMKAVIKGGAPIGGRKHKNLIPHGQKENSFHRTRSNGKEWQPKMAGHGAINDGRSGYFGKNGELLVYPTANKKTVWEVATTPFNEAHFAVFPEKLIVDCIKAGSSEHGCCAKCGAPYIRKRKPTDAYARVLGEGYHDHANDAEHGMMGCRGINRQNKMRDAGIKGAEYKTIKWERTCSCKGGGGGPPLFLQLSSIHLWDPELPALLPASWNEIILDLN